jgi:dienelactone hydrolase
MKPVTDNKPMPNMIGSYGPWAAESAKNWERRLSLLNPKWDHTDRWREAARNKVTELLAGPRIPPEVTTSVRVVRRSSFDDLDIEELTWQLPYGPQTEAVFLKPKGSKGLLPGILALHDHAGVKYFGKQKILRTAPNPHPFMFPFESRKIKAAELPGHVVKRMMSAAGEVEELTPEDLKKSYVITDYEVDEQEHNDRIEAYNVFAAQHEDIIAKSLISAGYSWPGVFIAEDRAALDVLCSRADIDNQRIGCCGLSLGGLRTDYLAGLDDRIRCSATVGFMTTWRDLILNNCYTHTWMLYIPLLSRYMDFPDVLGMRAPLPSLVLATEEDPLFNPEEVKRALNTLEQVYAKAGSPQNFSWTIHPGPHQFDRAMQAQAFEWLDHHLGQ